MNLIRNLIQIHLYQMITNSILKNILLMKLWEIKEATLNLNTFHRKMMKGFLRNMIKRSFQIFPIYNKMDHLNRILLISSVEELLVNINSGYLWFIFKFIFYIFNTIFHIKDLKILLPLMVLIKRHRLINHH